MENAELRPATKSFLRNREASVFSVTPMRHFLIHVHNASEMTGQRN
jgi:CMP-N-acetylneuraminic acid synthetase